VQTGPFEKTFIAFQQTEQRCLKKEDTYMADTPSDDNLTAITRRIRYLCLIATSQAGSGHPISAPSAADPMTAPFFGGIFRYEVNRPDHPNNDRLDLSKGHTSPLFYALWTAAGQITEQEMLPIAISTAPWKVTSQHPFATRTRRQDRWVGVFPSASDRIQVKKERPIAHPGGDIWTV
jgi:hypothetical protein